MDDNQTFDPPPFLEERPPAEVGSNILFNPRGIILSIYNSTCRSFIRLIRLDHHPVRIILIAAFLASLVESVSFGAIFDLYLKRIYKLGDDDQTTHANRFVGSVETSRGLTGLVVALPIGYFADRFTKLRILRLSTILGAIGISVCLYSVWTDSTTIIYVGSCVFAVYAQAALGLYGPILSDLVEPEKLTRTLSHSLAILATAQILGPLLQIIFIAAHRNDENSYASPTDTLRLSHLLLTIGMCSFFLVLPLFWMFRFPQSGQEHGTQLLSDSMSRLSVVGGLGVTGNDVDAGAMVSEWHNETIFGWKKRWVIPAFIELMNLVIACGSGMTFKFWPLFFEKDFDLSYLQISVISCLTWVSIVGFNLVVPKVTERLSSATTFLLVLSLSTILIFIVSQVHMPVVLTAILVVVQSGLLFASGPLNDGVVLSAVPSRHRAKWGAIQSVTRASWAGSSFLGGHIIDNCGYRTAFMITAWIHFGALLFNAILIFPTVRKKKRVFSPNDTFSNADDALVEPLNFSNGIIPDG